MRTALYIVAGLCLLLSSSALIAALLAAYAHAFGLAVVEDGNVLVIATFFTVLVFGIAGCFCGFVASEME